MAIVDEILEGKKDVIIGTREIRYYAIESYDFFSESKQYVYDCIGFETAYGLFDTIDELSCANELWQIDFNFYVYATRSSLESKKVDNSPRTKPTDIS